MRKKAHNGFTLIEVVTVLVIVVVLGIFIVPNFFKSSRDANLKNTGTQIVALLREAQSRATSQTQGSAWGVYFSNATTTAPFYALFSGTTYSSATTIGYYALPPNVCYGNIGQGSSFTVTFSQVSGMPSTITPIVLEPNFTGGCLGTIGGWSTTSPLPSSLNYASAAINNGYVYVVGGISISITSTVAYAHANGSGALDSWSTTTPLPAPIEQESVVASNGYLYSMGGIVGGGMVTVTSTVYYAQIKSSDGTVGNWSTTSPLPSVLIDQAAVVNNGYIYSIGGYVNGQPVDTVSYAKIHGDGTLDSWSTTTHLPSPIALQPAVVNNGYVYSIGGGTTSAGIPATSTVNYAPINTDGTLGAWSKTASLPIATYEQPAVVSNGYLYSIGGAAGNLSTSTVYYAPINGDGTLGAWLKTTSLSMAIYAQPAIANNGYIYSIGGIGGGGNLSTVYYVQQSTQQNAVGVSSTITISPQGRISL